ncbi:hypothetical protein SDC9_147321 [bioreactor metagenome]|uniref:Uncharacterized protein n=1 Tax=bioreactor metagenome TaxID=1076179 RepID=A0A645EED4_9ZZZZ
MVILNPRTEMSRSSLSLVNMRMIKVGNSWENKKPKVMIKTLTMIVYLSALNDLSICFAP